MQRGSAQQPRLLEWTPENGCNLIVSATAIPYHNDVQNDGDDVYIGNSMPTDAKPSVYAVSSTQSAAKKIREVGFLHLRSGTVTGIPSIWLSEGV